jgi:hypothetical protein
MLIRISVFIFGVIFMLSGISMAKSPSKKIGDGEITTNMLADEAVTTEKISDSAVTKAKIHEEAVDTAHLADGCVTAEKVKAPLSLNGSIEAFGHNGNNGVLGADWAGLRGYYSDSDITTIGDIATKDRALYAEFTKGEIHTSGLFADEGGGVAGSRTDGTITTSGGCGNTLNGVVGNYINIGTGSQTYGEIAGEYSAVYGRDLINETTGSLARSNVGVFGESGNGYTGGLGNRGDPLEWSTGVHGCAPDKTQGYLGGMNGAYGCYQGTGPWAALGTKNGAVIGRNTSSDTHFSLGTINYAGNFGGSVKIYGNLDVTGSVSKGSGGFLIDHPLDPDNKYLQHSFVESPDMMNIYNGIVVLGTNGEAWVDLPEWFEALNKDFRYQLTCIGRFAQVYIAEEISDTKFKIAGGIPGMKVSWQVTGIRQDPWANANRVAVLKDKPEEERRLYLHPQLYGQPMEKNIQKSFNQELAQRIIAYGYKPSR